MLGKLMRLDAFIFARQPGKEARSVLASIFELPSVPYVLGFFLIETALSKKKIHTTCH